MTAVAEETGIPYRLVSKYVKIDRLAEPVKDAVRSKEITMDAAIRGTQAADAMAGGEGLGDSAEALAFSQHMSNVSAIQQKKIVEVATNDPDKEFAEVLDAAEESREVQVIATLSPSVHSQLQEYATDSHTLQERAAATLIESGLDSAGYSTS